MIKKTSINSYIHSPLWDGMLIIAPPFLVLAILFCLPSDVIQSADVSPWLWMFLVVGIDVAHVYSTMFRSYLSKSAFQKYRGVMLRIPAISFAIAMMLYTIDPLWFWRCLAYLAVFHFIRQQYGFMKIYGRKEQLPRWLRGIQTITIYTASVYPIIYWHLDANREFHWFVDGDFMMMEASANLQLALQALYFGIVATYLVSTIYEVVQYGMNFPKHGLIVGTILSWYFGIVYFNADLTFTALNVVSHGIPYMALVWFTRQKELEGQGSPRGGVRLLGSVLVFLMVLITLAIFEEAMWDTLHWRDHPQFFSGLYFLPHIQQREWLSILIPLLALPQLTHYVLDGFIWKVSKKEVQQEIGLDRGT